MCRSGRPTCGGADLRGRPSETRGSDAERQAGMTANRRRRGVRPWTAVLALIAWLVAALPGTAQEEVQVEIETGRLVGSRQGVISVFRGIPYAAPPVGPLRWQPPQPVEPWTAVRSARRYGPVARQRVGGGSQFVASEDCLYLNVWTPAREGASLPVMVFIHGGGFATGSGSEPMYESTELAKQGVVVVTFNYRLDIVGFFAHPLLTAESPDGASGNYGLRDQVAALEWVQRNIERFGGDPERVTVFGESSGGRSVSVLLSSPLAEGLFQRAVTQSGTLDGVAIPLAAEEERGDRLARAVGCADRPDPLRCLRARTFDELAFAGLFEARPIVDGWMVPEDPRRVYADGRQHDVPMIIGSNADEGTFAMLGRRMPIRTVADYEEYVRRVSGPAADEVLGQYRAGTDDEVFQVLNRFDTDRDVARHVRRQARWMAGTSSNTYVYLFARVSPQHLWSGLGATHTAELPYLFGNLRFAAREGNLRTLELADRRLSQIMMRYWTRFAATGDPNGDGLPVWPSYLADETLLVLDAEVAPGGWPRADRLDLLDRLLGDQEPVVAGGADGR